MKYYLAHLDEIEKTHQMMYKSRQLAWWKVLVKHGSMSASMVTDLWDPRDSKLGPGWPKLG
jgi:hypothetical protein